MTMEPDNTDPTAIPFEYSTGKLVEETIAIETAWEVAYDTAGKPVWTWGPELADAILSRAADPWVDLVVSGELLATVRVGATVVIIGGSGSGKTSLTLGMLYDHARNVGPAILLSIELPVEEAAARLVGSKCDASWEESLRGKIPEAEMRRVLDLPRLCVLDRRRATIKNLEKAIEECRKRFPNQPILVGFDYAQLLDSSEREARMRVADAFAQIDDCAREKKFVALALSQMSRQNADKARQGEAIGADSASLGAESAAIERFATLTFAIGKATERDDGTSAVELSVGKARMSKGDRVYPMTYEGRTGRWRVDGEPVKAEVVRENRDVEKNEKADRTIEAALVGIAAKSLQPLSKNELKNQVSGKTTRKRSAIERLLRRQPPELVEVARKAKGAKKGDWMVWTPQQARDAGVPIVDALQPELGLDGGGE